MGLRGGMDSSILSRLPGGPRGDVRLPRTLMKTLKKGERIISLNIDVEIQIKPGHDKAASCSSYIFPSSLWISDKFGTYGKVFSRRIQRRRLREVWRRTRGGRRILPGDEPIGTDKGYWCFPIPDDCSLDSPLRVKCSPSIPIRFWPGLE